MTIVTPPNANPNSEFADIGTLEAPASSTKMISIGKTNNKRTDFYIVLVVVVKVTHYLDLVERLAFSTTGSRPVEKGLEFGSRTKGCRTLIRVRPLCFCLIFFNNVAGRTPVASNCMGRSR